MAALAVDDHHDTADQEERTTIRNSSVSCLVTFQRLSQRGRVSTACASPPDHPCAHDETDVVAPQSLPTLQRYHPRSLLR
jgi:hypothetical protein